MTRFAGFDVPPVYDLAIARAAETLRRGGLVAFPTETVYGLGADATQPAAVRAIFAAKGRPADHPVIVHVAAAQALDRWAQAVPAAAWRLAAAFWPGPLTLVLPRAAEVDDVVTGGQDTIGLRCPAHPWAQALLAAFGGALAAPSANRFGRISPTTAAHVRADLGQKPDGVVDLILDGGACPVGIESTIVDLSAEAPRLLRPGAITRAQLEAQLGAPLPDAGADAPRASGRLAQHYAPRTPVELIAAAALPARINALRSRRLAVVAPAGVLLDRPSQVIRRLLAPAEPVEYARRLYALLHEVDAAGADLILIAVPPAGGLWEAIHDRLRRAAATQNSPQSL
jgi:L-threonylcarbamoyladenylate synthase